MSKTTTILRAGRPSARASDKVKTLSSLSDDSDKLKRVNFELSPRLHSKLKIYAAKQGMSIKELFKLASGHPDGPVLEYYELKAVISEKDEQMLKKQGIK